MVHAKIRGKAPAMLQSTERVKGHVDMIAKMLAMVPPKTLEQVSTKVLLKATS
jgi:hypothetical protein